MLVHSEDLAFCLFSWEPRDQALIRRDSPRHGPVALRGVRRAGLPLVSSPKRKHTDVSMGAAGQPEHLRAHARCQNMVILSFGLGAQYPEL